MTRVKKGGKLIDLIVYLIIAFFFAINLLSFDYRGSDFSVVLTFYMIGIFSFYKIVTARKNITLQRVFYIFMFIFMFFAPLQQYLSGTILWKSNGLVLKYTDDDYLKANCALLLFIFLFEVTYKFSKRNKRKNQKIYSYTVRSNDSSMFFLSIISLLCCLFLLITGNIEGREGLDSENANILSQILNIIRFFPVACFFISICQRQKNERMFSINILFYMIEILIIYFPFNGSLSRVLLFGVYLSLMSLFFSHAETKSMYFLLFVVGFFFVFSAFNFFKTNGLENIRDFSFGLVDFNHVDYDAYQMFMATMHYVEDMDVCYGKNILTAIFCLIPRSIWQGKLYPTGSIVAEYYGTWFTNLSCPWIAECFFAFGWIGIIVGGIFTGWLFKWIDSFDYTLDFVKRSVFCIISGLLIYLLRGALLPTVSYTVALMISLLLVIFINNIFSKKKIDVLNARLKC